MYDWYSHHSCLKTYKPLRIKLIALYWYPSLPSRIFQAGNYFPTSLHQYSWNRCSCRLRRWDPPPGPLQGWCTHSFPYRTFRFPAVSWFVIPDPPKLYASVPSNFPLGPPWYLFRGWAGSYLQGDRGLFHRYWLSRDWFFRWAGSSGTRTRCPRWQTTYLGGCFDTSEAESACGQD